MAYSVTIYSNTGFNGANVPDSSARLTGGVSLPATDIMQNRWLSSITVRANYETVQNVDYCAVSNMFYFVTDVKMTSPDVAVLSLEPDFWTSAGGINGITILDGIVTRHHVTDDTFGKYRINDPFLTPTEPLELVSENHPLFGGDVRIVMESTVDVYATATYEKAYTATDELATGTVTYPAMAPLSESQYTVCYFQYPDNSDSYKLTLPGTRLIMSNSADESANAVIAVGIQKIRALSAESAIIYQYALPIDAYGAAYIREGGFDQIYGISKDVSTGLNYEYASVKNKRLLYGENNEYVLTSNASGNSVSFCPEDIYVSGESAPTIRYITDPRPEGKPYFRPVYFKGDSSNFFYNCVEGQQWASAPLIYTDKSGSTIDKYNFETERSRNVQNQVYNLKTRRLNALKSLGHFVGNLVNYGASGAVNMPLSSDFGFNGFAGDLMNMYEAAIEGNRQTSNYMSNLEQNDVNFAIEQNVIAPEINFPRSTAIRDYIGNGFVIYRLRYSDNDLTKLDKILTMYGYADVAPLTLNDFTSRQYFNYVQCSDVTVTGDFPIWMRNGISAQLRNGIRIWHTTPSPSYYTNNPVA